MTYERDEKLIDDRGEKKSKVGEAFHRDWEQTKHDISKKRGEELNQDVGDTVKQSFGKEPIPPRGIPNPEYKK